MHQHYITGINLIYATQTGTSYDLAKQFYLTFHNKIHIDKFINIQQLQQFHKQQSCKLFMFFISTTGQGDFPYSMRNLWKKMLNKSFGKLQWMNFTIYSFGDRSYGDNFCLAARKFRQRLISLGASQSIEIGLGDQQQPNGYLQEYSDKWLPNLTKFLQSNQSLIIKNNQQLLQTTKNNLNFLHKQSKTINLSITIKLLSRKQICSNKGRRTFTIDLLLQNKQNNNKNTQNNKNTIQVKCGDILSIYPQNNPHDIAYLMQFFKLSYDQLYSEWITYHKLFTSQLNISSTLNHSFFIHRPDLKDLSTYCQHQLYKAKLIELQSDYQEYHNYIKKYKRNIIQVLQQFQINQLPVDDFILRCNQLISRKYSISQILSKNHQYKYQQNQYKYKQINKSNQIVVRILFRLVLDKINQNRLHKGLCSHDMALYMDNGDTRNANILKGEFQYMQKKENHLICISLGTGIAPFIQHMDMAKNSLNKWNIYLFYTNRYQNQVYFQQNLQSLVSQNKLNPFLSFTGQGGKRIIRLVEDNLTEIKQIINNSNNEYKIMICGPKQVCEGMQNVLSKGLGLDFKILKRNKMFIYENW